MAEVLAQAGEIVQVLGDGPLAQVAFSAAPVTDHLSWLAADRARGRALMLALVEQQVFLNPMGTKLYLSLAHEECDLNQFAELLDSATNQKQPLWKSSVLAAPAASVAKRYSTWLSSPASNASPWATSMNRKAIASWSA